MGRDRAGAGRGGALNASAAAIWAPPDCDKCVSFAYELEIRPMLGEAWVQRDKLIIVFRAAHHDRRLGGFDLRAWWMISALKKGGWPHEALRSVAELVVELGL